MRESVVCQLSERFGMLSSSLTTPTCRRVAVSRRVTPLGVACAMRLGRATIILILFVLVLACGSGEGMAAGVPGGGADTPAGKVYRNERYGYEVRYPESWFPSRIAYGNAYEIRNYPPSRPEVRAPRNRATLLVVDMPMESRTDAARFLDGMLAQGSNDTRRVSVVTIDGRRAIRVTQRLPEQVRGPGTPRPAPAKRKTLLHVKTFVPKGSFVLQLWGVVRLDARKEVIAEVIAIEDSVTFS
jgi:hypothetical protein